MKKVLLICLCLFVQFQLFGQCNLSISYTKADYQCQGGGTQSGLPIPLYGSITASVAGGTAPFQYKLNNGNFQSSNLFDNLNAGIYTLIVQDSTNCIDSTTITIDQPLQPLISIINTTLTACQPLCDGTLSLQASGGTAPYQYGILFPLYGAQIQASNTISGLCEGSYTAIVIDSNGCVNSIPALISTPTPMTFSNIYIIPSCDGGANGSISVSALGGIGTVSYTISPIASTNTIGQFFNLPPQTYIITASDLYCQTTTTITVPVTQGPSISVTNITNASCPYGCDGSAQVISIAGTSLTISGAGSPLLLANGQVASLCANSSYIILASDANNCVSTTAFTVGVSSNITSPNISYIHHPSCAPGSDGYIVIPNIINTPFYNYDFQPSWPSMSQSNDTIKGIPSGTYTITVTDPFIGCYAYATVSLYNQPVTVNSITPSGCTPCTGSVTLNSAINSTITVNPSANIVNNSLITNLCGGTTYTIMATDASNCTSSTTAYIANQLLQLSIISITLPTCIPGNNGAINVIAIGTNPINYSIDGNQIQQSNTTGNFTGLTAQQYTISATDANNCIQTTVYSLNSQFQSLSVLSTNNTCQNTCYGTAQVYGQGIISYTINGIGNPIINSNGMASNLCHSFYNIIGTDANGCTSSTNILINIASSPTIQISNIKAPICSYPNSGSFILNNYNSNPNITYTISPPVNYSVNNDTIQGLSTGTYTVTATEINGCTKTQIVYIPITTSIFIKDTILSLPTCFANCNGVVQLTSMNALPNMKVYRYPTFFSNVRLDSVELSIGLFQNLCEDWHYFRIEHNGCVSNTISTNLPFDQSAKPEVSITYPCIGSSNGTIKVLSPKINTLYTLNPMPNGAIQISHGQFNNLTHGGYTLYSLDTVLNCLVTKQIYIGNATLNSITSSSSCSNSSNCDNWLTFRPSNQNPPLTYTFNPGNLISKINDTIFSGFCKDSTYQITITDSLGCVTNQSKKIFNTPSTFTFQKTTAHCINCNGSITANANSTSYPHTFLLRDSNTNYSNFTGIFTGLCPGNYTLTVTDANGLCAEKIITLNPFSTQKILTLDSCFGSCKAKAMITPFGVFGSYSMSITPNIGSLSGNIFSNLCAGTYSLQITDSSPCTLDTVFTIYDPAELSLNIQEYYNSVCNLPNGQIELYPSGGNPPYNFVSNVGSQNGWQVSQLPPGTYTFYVSDANHCKDSILHTVVDTIPHFIDSVITSPASCYIDDGSIWIAHPFGPPYYVEEFSLDKINWSHLTYLEYLKSGPYKIFAKTVDGCIDSATTYVGFKNNLQVVDLNLETERCAGTDDGKISLPVNDFTYSIEPYHPVDHQNRVIENLPVGTYTLTATDARGCSGTTVVFIAKALPLELTTQLIYHTYGDCHGEVQVLPVGGTTPYTISAEPENFVNISDSGKLHYLCNTNYEITVTDKNGCRQTQHIFIPYQDIDGDDFAIYPNPAQHEFAFIFTRNVDVVITLSDVSGRILHDRVYVEKNKVSLPVSHLSNGVYFVTLNFDGQKFVRKLEVRH